MGIKFVINDKGKSYQTEKETNPLVGKKIGEAFDGTFLGLNNSKLQITGGSDKDGFPMKLSIDGIVKKRLMLEKRGSRKKKTVRGNTISTDTVQINCKVIIAEKPLEEVFAKKEKKEEDNNK
ncbi:MAG: S6e family ribosomal protein [Candidatus Aenigmatarchaeota archaeon]